MGHCGSWMQQHQEPCLCRFRWIWDTASAHTWAGKANYALWIWTYTSSVLAHTVFLNLPASAAWGGMTMGIAVIPLIIALRR